MATDRRERAEQLERMRERVKAAVEAMAQWEAHVDAAIAKAKTSLDELRKSLAKLKS